MRHDIPFQGPTSILGFEINRRSGMTTDDRPINETAPNGTKDPFLAFRLPQDEHLDVLKMPDRYQLDQMPSKRWERRLFSVTIGSEKPSRRCHLAPRLGKSVHAG